MPTAASLAANRRKRRLISRRPTERRLSPARLAVAAVALAGLIGTLAAAAPLDPTFELKVQARATGSDRADALTIARAILGTVWPAQVLHIRVDRVGRHRVAGIIVSGVKFHRSLRPADFTAEIEALARRAFATVPVEEVDLWATVPLDAGVGTVVSGDLAKPTSRIVFSVTVPRARLAGLTAQLQSGHDVYWDPAFRSRLVRKDSTASR